MILMNERIIGLCILNTLYCDTLRDFVLYRTDNLLQYLTVQVSTA